MRIDCFSDRAIEWGKEGSGFLIVCPPGVTQADGGRSVFEKARMADEPINRPRFLSPGLHRHEPEGHRHGAVLFEVLTDGGNRGAGEEATDSPSAATT